MDDNENESGQDPFADWKPRSWLDERRLDLEEVVIDTRDTLRRWADNALERAWDRAEGGPQRRAAMEDPDLQAWHAAPTQPLPPKGQS